ncbi:TlpA disulfide reductase family protein [Sphingobacterium sp.]|uniref:TlpA family protein disulfide reductase n=1 Tax=Sphingobacterium sp. TaxID=341027 RepID=UPI002897019F|nr:TlpA disulfide reductase family protein [Sphingobacterium sp.]
MKRTWLSAFFGLAVLGLTACGNSNERKADTQDSAVVNSDTTQQTAQTTTHNISFLDEKGNAVDLNSLKGKVVFINFWATWCPPCIEELPSIDNLRKEFKGNDNVVFLMVDVDSEIEQSTAFMKDNQYDLPVFIPNSEIPSDFLAGAIPTTVILDKEGNMVDRMEGGRDYNTPEMKEKLSSLANK